MSDNPQSMKSENPEVHPGDIPTFPNRELPKHGQIERGQGGGQETFMKSQRALERGNLSPQERADILARRDAMIEDASIEGLFNDARIRIANTIKNSTWDDLHQALTEDAQRSEKLAEQMFYQEDPEDPDFVAHPEWRGMVLRAVLGARDELLLRGIEQQEKDNPGDIDWYYEHGYDQRTLDALDNSVAINFFGDILSPNAQNFIQSKEKTQQSTQTNLTKHDIAEGVAEGQRQVARENRPSLQQSLRLFHEAERMCKMYEANDLELMKQQIRATGNELEIRIIDSEVKVFNAALLKNRQYKTMKSLFENPFLKDIKREDVLTLLNDMPGYLFAMQEIADVVVNRKHIFGLNFSLLDCQNDDQFREAAEAFDQIVAGRLMAMGISSREALALAYRAVNTAVNTMYAFNVFEYYNSYWEGNVRHKYLESKGTAPSGREGASYYDRLIAKPIYDSMNPIDDLINEALKPTEKKPNKNNIVQWAATQMANQGLLSKGVKQLSDFDEVRIIGTKGSDPDYYWRVKNEGGRKVLLVPPIRPTKIYGSILDSNKVNIIVANTRRRFLGLGGTTTTTSTEKKAFIQALADHDQIDLGNIGLSNNFCELYTLNAGDVDTLKDALRDKKELKDWLEIKGVLGNLEVGTNIELIAWLYVDLSDALNPKKRAPELIHEVIYNTRLDREYMGLPRRDNFNIIDFVNNLPPGQRNKYQ